ncbi:MAG: hypothetical protein PWQ25_1193 [Deferribacteres bacterium]|jgi:hypothetical protein|nr:hypothetical protein [Deferribacteraceae bacterium]MDK2792330.1 hypothetical protein [Deferribacteres bacterium]
MSFLLLIIYIFFTGILLYFGIKNFPGEKYQFLAIIPFKKSRTGEWYGINITYYGLLNAISYSFSTALFLTLTMSYNISFKTVLFSVLIILSICMPASKLMARLVENKKNTFTVSGASFVGSITAPFVVLITSYLITKNIDIALNESFVVLSSLAISYITGEGIGRLACLSFGCCYGKKVSDFKGPIKKIFEKFYTVFEGKTKKISYESGCENVKTIPVQSVASILFNLTGILAIIFYSQGYIKTAFLTSVIVINLFRFLSEFLRNDFRGNKKVSTYQYFSIINIIYSIIISLLFNTSNSADFNILNGINEASKLKYLLIAIFVISFLYTGVSKVTYSTIKFKVMKSNI